MIAIKKKIQLFVTKARKASWSKDVYLEYRTMIRILSEGSEQAKASEQA